MKIVCCVKQVLDPEIPPGAFHVADDGRSPEVRGIPESRVIDSYGENAVETAVQLRDEAGEGEVIGLAVGGEEMDDALRRGLALTADRGVRVWDPSWGELDGITVGLILAAAVKALGGADLILCGREASDVEEGVVGPAIAEALDLPCVTIARRVDLEEGRLRVERETDGLIEVLTAEPPVVVTVTSSDANVPRMPKVRDVMLSKGKPIRVLGPDELKTGVSPGPRTRLRRLLEPEARGECERVEGEDGPAIAGALLDRLAREQVL
ncbi:MAG: electron transfer flavoprotein subunit beta/FixA family protein [Gemmatimonadetes bacterium]|nr:electron transfer flavoprotein subunit beta/FixA family protein [Gemmatimonadota bacterium]NIR81056.1 electron transfer flavoprotein subunit beta/FixA family protein [Gemmatimonadota bacterium]NIT89874.1 electron transfer flavoprotein subunit beta/FixA family protein [Gemmatimonadota bacterium]NIU33673.1 electron transfer flavoprotein subunit beta/FixA family protein [Gemmatimonadota bacterium]NIU37916.1 electron transfer flavoprotein subunit beta/FixA family protein [Gemmatimonadota bacteri